LIPPSGPAVVKNDPVHVPVTLQKRQRTVTSLVLALFVTTFGVAGCGRSHPPHIGGPTTPAATTLGPADRLAGFAAAAQDQKYVAAYTYRSHGHADRTVVVSVAQDGTWSVNVPGGALGGGADVSIVGTKDGVYQCVLGGVATTLGPPPSVAPVVSPSPGASPSPPPPAPTRITAPACTKVAAAGHTVPSRYDPIMEHPFTDWLTILSSRNAPVSVFNAQPVTGAAGTCFSIEPSAASLAPVVQAGIFCFLANGTLTSMTLANSSLTMVGTPAPGAPTNTLPGPITPGPAVPTRAATAS
jgi:hypothetical protein